MRFVHVWLNIFHEYWNKNQISWLSRQINIHIDNNILWMNEEKSTNVWYKYIYFINLVFSLLQEPPILQISEKELTFCIITNWTKFSLIRFFISLFWFLLILLELKPPYEPLCPSIGRSVGRGAVMKGEKIIDSCIISMLSWNWMSRVILKGLFINFYNNYKNCHKYCLLAPSGTVKFSQIL